MYIDIYALMPLLYQKFVDIMYLLRTTQQGKNIIIKISPSLGNGTRNLTKNALIS